MQEPNRFSIPVKIAVAAIVILLVDAALVAIFDERRWQGFDTLLAAAQLTPLSALFWPLFETGGYTVLFGIDYARQAIWERRQKEAAKAQAAEERRQEELAQALAKGREEGREQGREEGYQLGYAAGVAEERRRTNGNGHNWMFGDYDDYC